jgi:O-succinylbenzoic acid--CoA ligase
LAALKKRSKRLPAPRSPEKATIVQDWLLWRSNVSPELFALRFGTHQYNYKQLQEMVSNISGLLRSWGIKKGDRVALLLNSSELYVMAIHALTRLGAVTIPLNVRQSSSELSWQISDCEPSLILYDSALADLKKDIDKKNGEKGSRIKIQWKSADELKESSIYHSEPMEGGTIDTSLLHSIIYTSGSTGTPKGVEITVSNLLWNAISFGIRHGAIASDRWLLAMPIFHVGGYTVIFRSVLHGSGIVLHPKFELTEVSRSIVQDGITLVSLVPTMLVGLLEKLLPDHLPSNLRLIFLGGSNVSRQLMHQIIERRLPVVLTYGMTESCSQIAISDPLRGEAYNYSYQVMFPTSVTVRKNAGEEGFATNRPGIVGEILLRGPTIFGGYWGKRRDALSVFKGGWFHTGDLGYIDSQGGIVVLGRENDMIISGGENIYPMEVESNLLEHEAIEDAIVFGKDDPKWGQRVEAILKVKEGFNRPSASELSLFLREKIGSYKIPKAYHFLASSSFSKTQSGKTKRSREIIEELLSKNLVHESRRDRN